MFKRVALSKQKKPLEQLARLFTKETVLVFNDCEKTKLVSWDFMYKREVELAWESREAPLFILDLKYKTPAPKSCCFCASSSCCSTNKVTQYTPPASIEDKDDFCLKLVGIQTKDGKTYLLQKSYSTPYFDVTGYPESMFYCLVSNTDIRNVSVFIYEDIPFSPPPKHHNSSYERFQEKFNLLKESKTVSYEDWFKFFDTFLIASRNDGVNVSSELLNPLKEITSELLAKVNVENYSTHPISKETRGQIERFLVKIEESLKDTFLTNNRLINGDELDKPKNKSLILTSHQRAKSNWSEQ